MSEDHTLALNTELRAFTEAARARIRDAIEREIAQASSEAERRAVMAGALTAVCETFWKYRPAHYDRETTIQALVRSCAAYVLQFDLGRR